MTVALFIGFAALLVGCSLMVVLHRNPVTSALFLVLGFCSLAGIYLLLHAEFIAMVQIIVYAGAIMVLFLFVIMYLNLKRDVERGVHIAFRRGAGWILGALLLAEGWLLFGRRVAPGPVSPDPALAAPIGNTQAIGQELYTRYLFPFEITSMLLLIAMVGAVVIAKGRGPGVPRREPARALGAADSPAPALSSPAGPEEDAAPAGARPAPAAESPGPAGAPAARKAEPA